MASMMAMMQLSHEGESDPRAWCALIALAFLVLTLFRLDIPSKVYFDEVHYVEAARRPLALDEAWRRGRAWRGASLAMITASFALFAWFWPILSAAPLAGGRSAFVEWMWLDSWR